MPPSRWDSEMRERARKTPFIRMVITLTRRRSVLVVAMAFTFGNGFWAQSSRLQEAKGTGANATFDVVSVRQSGADQVTRQMNLRILPGGHWPRRIAARCEARLALVARMGQGSAVGGGGA